MISFNLWSNARKFCYQLTKYCGSNRKLLSNILHLEGQKLYYHTLETSRNNEETKKFEAKNKDKAKPLKKIHNSSLVPIKLTSRNLVRRKYYNVIDKFVNLARFVFTSKIPNLNLGINQFLSRISKNLLKEDTNNSQYSNSLYILKNCKWLIHSDGKIYGYGSNQVDSTNNAAHSVRFSTECKEPLKSKESSNHGRHNYHQDVECAVNQQILAELNASYAYLSMACYFGRTDVALPGCQGFFLKMHEEEHQHALKLIKYQNMRGGTVKLCPISASEVQDWGCILNALEVSLELEKLIKEKLICLHNIAEKHRDLAVMDMITTDFIQEQDRSICEFGRLVTRSKKMCGGCGCTEFLFDREIFKAFVKKRKNDRVYI